MSKIHTRELETQNQCLYRNFKQRLADAAYLTKPTHLQSVKDRYEAGRALRQKCPRSAHAEYTVDSKGRGDPIQLLIASTKGRIETLLPIRYGRMTASSFNFLRGAAVIMAADLAMTPTTEYAVQSCGDCHLLNFGGFATPERNIIFDINDFDETFPASWEWDLKRLAASFVIASLSNGHKRADGVAAAAEMVRSYRDKMHQLANMQTLEAWYSFMSYEDLLELKSDKRIEKRYRRRLARALERDANAEFVRLGHIKDNMPRIREQPPLIYHEPGSNTDAYRKRVQRSFERYRHSLPVERRVLLDRYELKDVATKVVGVGSVGTRCSVALFFAGENDPLFLQIKEALQSVLEPFSSFTSTQTHGARVVTGQRLMQAASDLFLGYFVDDAGRHFYIRQLRDVKMRPLVEDYNPSNMLCYARNCGWTLAMAHARSGDPAIIAGYIGKGNSFVKAIAQFADTYASQNEADYSRLLEAVRTDTGLLGTMIH